MKAWILSLRIVGVLACIVSVLDILERLMRIGEGFINWSAFLGGSLQQTLQGIALGVLCFGSAAVLNTFDKRNRRDLERHIAEQQRILARIEEIANTSQNL